MTTLPLPKENIRIMITISTQILFSTVRDKVEELL